MPDFREVNWEQVVKPLISRGAAERVSLQNGKTKTWFGAFVDDALYGVASFAVYGSTARINNVWFYPEFRGKGVGQEFMRWLIKRAEEKCFAECEYFALDARWWLRNGFKEKRVLPNGVIVVNRLL